MSVLSHAPNRLLKPIWPPSRHQHPHLPRRILRLQVRQEDQDSQVGPDGLRHWHPDTRGDGTSGRPAQKYLGKDHVHYFLGDHGFPGLGSPPCDAHFLGDVLCTLWLGRIYRPRSAG